MNAAFARVLAEAGEPAPAELPAGGRALAEIREQLTALNARRLARWLANAPAREQGLAAYREANRAIYGRDLEGREPWSEPPPPVQIW
jgi:hypothetical protein